MIVKVCGMNDYRNIQEVAALPVGWIGFIFYHKSPRATTGFAAAIPDLLPREGQKRVGVFVNATQEAIHDIAKVCQLSIIQLHGDETPDFCHALQKRGYSLVKAFAIAKATDFEATLPYEGRVDYFLFDTHCEARGGSGRQFDWSLLQHYRGDTPFLLSGGIGPDDADAIRGITHPRLAGIDLNSGFEIRPGLKDTERLRVFLDHLLAPESSTSR